MSSRSTWTQQAIIALLRPLRPDKQRNVLADRTLVAATREAAIDEET